jgi:hypothetical protein
MMKEPPKVKMSVSMGRDFMMIDSAWFDTNMCGSANGLTPPAKDCVASEKIKYTLCAHATNTYKTRNGTMLPEDITELMWFTHGFVPCSLVYQDIAYIMLVSIRGVCWISHPPVEFFDPDGSGYKEFFEQASRVRNKLRKLISDERQML